MFKRAPCDELSDCYSNYELGKKLSTLQTTRQSEYFSACYVKPKVVQYQRSD